MGDGRIRLGLVGLGNIIDSHLQALDRVPAFQVAAVCDLDEARRAAISERLQAPGYASCGDLLRAGGVDAVLVAVPHGLHCDIAVQALQAGVHVLVEKPMAVSADQCRRMLAAAVAARCCLQVADSAAWLPGPRRTGQAFAAGDLGRFLTGSIVNERYYFHTGRPAWFLDPEMSGGGMFANVGLHRLAVARACLPGLTPATVSAVVGRVPEHPVEACTSALVRYREGGAMLYEEVGYFQRPAWLNTGTHLVFEAGIVSWDGEAWRMATRAGEEVVEDLPEARGYAPVYEDFLAGIQGRPTRYRARDFAEDTVVAQAAYASGKAGAEVDLEAPKWQIPFATDTHDAR